MLGSNSVAISGSANETKAEWPNFDVLICVEGGNLWEVMQAQEKMEKGKVGNKQGNEAP